ncbi:hypothetical protein D9Q98_001957 [Chlorella vulgaris]|uniref:DUF4605 domain-containing protein n=1 Tax=Chlorella vulgaris TaxID=3077 RepID=A0A9D4YZT5_CHLVU|nr:hypothetical protein D9Q98_001957 [Chlorella vulgaris]
MVRIIDGEIVQDDDPRVTGHAAAPPPARQGPPLAQPPPPTAARRGGFDFSAPPLRLVPDDSGSNIANLPNLVVFGRTIHPQHVLMLVAACAFFGLKGLVVGGILFYVYISNDQPAQNRDGGRGQQAGTQNPVQHVLGQVPLGRGDSAAARRSGDPWAARGRPRKLSEPN